MAGIQRVEIISDKWGTGSWRFKMSKKHWPIADTIYRSLFTRMGISLQNGTEVIKCTDKKDAQARLDWQFGIDVILRFENGMRSTLQEKILFPQPGGREYRTVTIEYMQNPEMGEQGDWFNMSVQYYFVAQSPIAGANDEPKFSEWVLYDYAALQRGLASGDLQSVEQNNTRDGARASFRWLWRSDIPLNYVIANSSDYIQSPKIQQSLLELSLARQPYLL